MCLLREAVHKLQVTTLLEPAGELLNGSRDSVDVSDAWPQGRGAPALLPPSSALPSTSQRAAAHPTGTGSPAIKNNTAALH